MNTNNTTNGLEIVIVCRKPSMLVRVSAIVNAPYVWVESRGSATVVVCGSRAAAEAACAKLDAAGVSYRA